MRVELLADHEAAVPTLASWFLEEWPEYYGPLGVEAALEDLKVCCNRDGVPIGVVALDGTEVCGTAALKVESITTHKHLGPWLAALLVAPSKRDMGVGRMLIKAVEDEASRLGLSFIYTGTGAVRLFERAGWEALERVMYHGQEIMIFRRDLGRTA